MTVLKVKDCQELKALIALSGNTISSISKSIKISPTSINKYLKGENVRPDKAKKISDYLGKDVSYFFEQSGR
ncbi:helix-turn-helix domain-containing protein [Fructobacillus papyrifericola]|uniref:Helix-turn-helix domain-containing protein n=1 Tax=Fructobacillus papyrifericola TaxID=2713172 RepID=A0ABS5QTC1_9LACO|nr:helix-turn-helix domain-containing protein [Fructobacillus papyrifericola]MBS9336444.1 helix-turn-helix domain-containing protein [Fructobacillus papyrifericola]